VARYKRYNRREEHLMSVRVTVNQVQEQLPELLDRAVESGEEFIIERDGQDYAVLISVQEWQRQREDLDHIDPTPGRTQARKRRQEIGQQLDALGPEYRLSREKQARAEELLSRKADLTREERREMDALLRESDAIMLRRAEALDRA
jgi:antitoxin (DNA-binding transcriptional repressor) of toxin-antitoxin stability system